MEQEIDIRQIFGIIRRQIWLILAVVFIVVAGTSAITFTLTPKYTATAKVLVDPSTKNLLNPDARPTYSSNESNARVDSEVEILDSDNAITQVIKDQNLISDPEFGVTLGFKDKILAMLNLKTGKVPDGQELLTAVVNKFKKVVSVKRIDLTYLISVSVTSSSPEKAAKLANALVQTYIDQQIASKVSQTLAARNVIQAQIGQANAAIVDGEKQFDQYMEMNLSKLEAQSGSQDIARLRSELEQIKTTKAERSDALQAATSELTNGNYSALADTLKSDAVKELERQRSALTDSLASLSPDNKKAVNLRAALDKINADLQTQATSEVKTLKSQLSNFDNQAADIRQQLRSSILTANLPPEVLTDIYSLKQKSEIARNQYENLLSRQKELDTQAQLQVADSRIVNEALIPASPSFPKTGMIIGLALVASFGLGIGLAFVRENFIGGFVSDEQVENVLRIPLAAVVGKQSSSNVNVHYGMADIIVSSPMSVFSESIRKVRVKLERLIYERTTDTSREAASEGLVVLVTSSVPNEGKSTVSLSLARTLASSGKRTLLIDADLRKPSIHKALGLEPSTELSELLQGPSLPQSIAGLTTADPMSGLKVVLGGRSHNFATDELVMGERFTRLISIARKHFDYIVIDTPPIDPVVDGLYLARHADIIAFVVRWGSTPQMAAKRSVAALMENARPGTFITAVINQKERNNMRSYYRYSGYYTE
jgi:polysaccharide biosynthesis transport protein